MINPELEKRAAYRESVMDISIASTSAINAYEPLTPQELYEYDARHYRKPGWVAGGEDPQDFFMIGEQELKTESREFAQKFEGVVKGYLGYRVTKNDIIDKSRRGDN